MTEDLQKKLQVQLEEWKKEITKLKEMAEKADAESQIKYYKQIEDLREKQAAARGQLEKLRREGEDAWKEIKNDAGKTWKNIKSTLKETKKAFNEGLAEKKEKKK